MRIDQAIESAAVCVFLENAPTNFYVQYLVYWGRGSGRLIGTITTKPNGFYEFYPYGNGALDELQLLGLYGKLRELNEPLE